MYPNEFRALLIFPLSAAFACNFSVAAEPRISDRDNADWQLAIRRDNLTIFSRPHPGSSLKEFKAIGSIDAATGAVHQVIDDISNYPNFMPYVTESRLLKLDGESVIAYQRISPKLCSDRDYALRIHETSWVTPSGLAYLNRWEPVNEFAPPKKAGVVRINLCQGSWLLEPEGPEKTRATYSVYTGIGGIIPSFIANHFGQTAIEKIFAAVRERVKDPQYTKS